MATPEPSDDQRARRLLDDAVSHSRKVYGRVILEAAEVAVIKLKASYPEQFKALCNVTKLKRLDDLAIFVRDYWLPL